MSQEVRGNDAPFILNAVERAIIRVPRSNHHGLTKIPTAVNIAGKTYLDLARLTDIDTHQLPQVVLSRNASTTSRTHTKLSSLPDNVRYGRTAMEVIPRFHLSRLPLRPLSAPSSCPP